MPVKPLDNDLLFLPWDRLELGKNEAAPLCEVPEDVFLFSQCREGLRHIARTLECENKRVLLPCYTCETVI